MSRSGKAIGGGLFFTDEFNKEEILKVSGFRVSSDRRIPTVFSSKDWTIYVDLENKFNSAHIFDIITDHYSIMGHVRLEIKEKNNLPHIILTCDDGHNKYEISTIRKDVTKLKICCNMDSDNKTISMWINNEPIAIKTIARYRFPKPLIPLIIWNKENKIKINDCAGWSGEKSKQFTIKTKRLLTS